MLGAHIENTRTPYLDYPEGTTFQPDEHVLNSAEPICWNCRTHSARWAIISSVVRFETLRCGRGGSAVSMTLDRRPQAFKFTVRRCSTRGALIQPRSPPGRLLTRVDTEIIEHLVVAEREVLKRLPEPSQLAERKRSLKHHITYDGHVQPEQDSRESAVARHGAAGKSFADELRRQWTRTRRG